MDGVLIAGTMAAGLIVFDGILGTPVAGLLTGLYVGDLIRRHNQKMRDHVLGD